MLMINFVFKSTPSHLRKDETLNTCRAHLKLKTTHKIKGTPKGVRAICTKHCNQKKYNVRIPIFQHYKTQLVQLWKICQIPTMLAKMTRMKWCSIYILHKRDARLQSHLLLKTNLFSYVTYARCQVKFSELKMDLSEALSKMLEAASQKSY